MKGKVLDFSIQSNTGIILGDNGSRYPFTGQQWKEQINPIRGTAVDFEVNSDQQAIAIYIDTPIPAQPSSLNKTAHESIPTSSVLSQQILQGLEQATDNHYYAAILNCFKKFADFKGRSARSGSVHSTGRQNAPHLQVRGQGCSVSPGLWRVDSLQGG